jgi:hypothetical protein
VIRQHRKEIREDFAAALDDEIEVQTALKTVLKRKKSAPNSAAKLHEISRESVTASFV